MVRAHRSPRGRPGPLPGGCARPNESAREACTREVLEETGLSVSPHQVLTVH
ncbi:NUDIX domain-containing protein [Streptomyces sp. NPDC058220]|uniref:NUDIX domain-containing protein n=1 Tax=unclassified Streptomyces TaxID=2593676 RepID=UPI0036622DCD